MKVMIRVRGLVEGLWLGLGLCLWFSVGCRVRIGLR